MPTANPNMAFVLTSSQVAMSHFSPLSWAVVGSYIVTVCAIGSFFYARHSSAADYFLGGRKMRVIPVAISLVAADLSAITYMGTPAWAYDHNLELFLGAVSMLLVAPIVMYVFMPFYSRFSFFTGYEYLERRFDLKIRVLGAALFLLTRGSHVAIVIYAPSILLAMLTGFPLSACILLMGGCTTLYTTLGGMKAVIWTDVIQFSILLTGIATVFGLCIYRIPGGIHAAYDVALSAGRLHHFDLSLRPDHLSTVWAMLIGNGTMVLSTMGTDQALLQRYFTTRSLGEARRAVLLDAFISVPLVGLLHLLGIVIFAFYHFYPDRLAGLPAKDAILPYFVFRESGSVLSGLVIASIFASSMAVMSAGINSLTTVTTVDFYTRLFHSERHDRRSVFVGRIGTVIWGLATTVGALFASRLGPLVTAFSIINSFLGGPILGLFLLGMLSKRVSSTAALWGGTVGLIVVTLVAWKSNISFFYYAIIGLIVTVAIAYLASALTTRPSPYKLKGLVRGNDIPDNAKAETV